VYIYDIISDKSCRENQNVHFIINIFFSKVMPLLDNVEKYGTARQATVDSIRRRRFACCFTKAIDTHSEYVIFIAFPLQQWLYDRASMLHLYVQCVVTSAVAFVLQYSELRNWSIGLYLIHISYN
jgi:hypothetical protein